MIGGTEYLELERELDHPARRCSNACPCGLPPKQPEAPLCMSWEIFQAVWNMCAWCSLE
jgi:hypothetical protein